MVATLVSLTKQKQHTVKLCLDNTHHALIKSLQLGFSNIFASIRKFAQDRTQPVEKF